MAKITSRKRIAIIGSGASGLTAIKCCLEEALTPVCFERDDDVGGLWNYSAEPKEDKGGIYKSCVINTSKEMMCFSDFPIDEDFPPFMPHYKVLEYLKQYADNFSLHQHIRFNVSVTRVEKAEGFTQSGQWKVTSLGNNGVESVSCEIFDGVMVCTGHHVYPHIPSFPGFEIFSGAKVHSKQYKIPDAFVDKSVLIIGKYFFFFK